MIRKEDGERIMRKNYIAAARSSSNKINSWISDILRNATRPPTEAGSSTEGPPSMGTPPWKGLRGDE